MTVGGRSAVDPRLVELAQLVQGTVVTSADGAYDSARRLYSPRYDGVRPGAIVFCETAQDVWRTVRWSRRHSIRVVARSGGHSYAGYSTCKGVVVDVTRMSGITVNHAAGTATIGAGARLVDVDQALFQEGVMIPAGSCPSVGIAGLTLGGGHGFSGRKYGLTCDNVRSLIIVTASGQALLASQTQHPDLYWACRGGGAGQFGIVTSFVFNTHPASDVVTYRATWNWSDAAAVVAAWQAWAPTAPDDLFSMCDLIATDGPGGPIVASNGQYFGSEAGLQSLLQPLVNAAAPQTMTIRTRSFINAALDWANCSDVARCHIGVPSAELSRSDFLAKSDYVATRASGRWNPDHDPADHGPPERPGARRRQHPHGRLRRRDQPNSEKCDGIRAPRPALFDPVRRRGIERRRCRLVARSSAPRWRHTSQARRTRTTSIRT